MSTSGPEPTEISHELALDRALWWIDRQRDSSAWLWFGGTEGAGKTRLLREIARQRSDSLFLDCSGMHSEEIARKLADSLGVAALDTYDRNFAQAVSKINTGPVVILANTQWAGSLRTTREPERVLRAVQTLIRNHRRSVRMRLLVEVEDTTGPITSLRGRALTLRGPDRRDAHSTGATEPVETTALTVLALAESRSVPLPVWSILCSALGQDVSVEELEQLASSDSAETLTQTSGAFAWSNVAFLRESTARAWRETVSPEKAKRFHLQVLAALSSAEPTSAVHWYVHRAAAGHAAAAGAFESLLEDAPTLAKVGHHSLFEAFEAVYHNRLVHPASLSANLYYLAERGVWPSTHGEWLALLHHSLLNRGPSGMALADRLLAAVDSSALPWHTMWAHGTGPGTATTARLVKRPTVRRLRIVQADSGSLVIATDVRGNSNVWRLDNGEPTVDPGDAPMAPESFAADQGLRGWRPAGTAEGHVDLPRMPKYVEDAVRTGDRAVLSSHDGVFAIAIRLSEAEEAQSGILKRMMRTSTKLATADFPAEALDSSAEWFEQVWGTTPLKRLTEDALPPDLSDADARQFLTEVGFPCVRNFLELETLDLSTTGLTAVSDSTVSQGTGFLLGTWQGAPLLLDGTSGQVLQDESSGIDPLAGSSLRQFVTMVRLYYWWYASDWSIEDTEADLKSWLARIDPAAYAARCWQRVFEDYNFADRV